MKYYGNHWTSDDGTELQIRFELQTLELWARSCPKGGEWQAWRRLDVERDGNGVLLETTANALKAREAENAAKAALADLATRALAADKAVIADMAVSASHAHEAYKAARADHADNASHANAADSAAGLESAVPITITGAVTGSGMFNGVTPTTIPTVAGDAFAKIETEIDTLKAQIGSLNAALNGAQAANGTLAARIATLEKKIADMESAASSGAVTLETLSQRTNLLFDMDILGTLPAGQQHPVWWGDPYYPRTVFESRSDNN